MYVFVVRELQCMYTSRVLSLYLRDIDEDTDVTFERYHMYRCNHATRKQHPAELLRNYRIVDVIRSLTSLQFINLAGYTEVQ
jgi:hypothetical protein